jgi:diguanylate cyclase (GGDEF)-like protein/PAS domain S-box-containing protein
MLLLWLAFSACAIAVTDGMVGFVRTERLVKAEVESQNYARLLEQDVRILIRSLDLMLQNVAVLYPEFAGRDRTQADKLVDSQAAQYPDIDALVLTDAQGRVLASNHRGTVGVTSTADRDYFITLRNQPDAGLLISRPVLGKISQRWVIVLAHAIHDMRGRFAGVVAASIPLDRLNDPFLALKLGKSGAYNLFDNEFRVITRIPEANADGKSSIGQQFNSPGLNKSFADGLDHGTYRTKSSIDKVDRIYSYSRLRAYGLNFSVGVDVEVYLADWRKVAYALWSMAGLVILISGGFAWRLHIAWQRQAQQVQRLMELNLRLDQETAMNQTIVRSSPFAIYTRDRQGIVKAWNPAAEKLFGWRADEMVGGVLLSVPEDKQDETKALRARVLAGESIIDLEVQRQKRDGTLFDLSSTMAPLRDAEGQINGYLSIASDLSARKAAERQVEFLAYRDVLTGLPNRLLAQDRFSQAVAHADRLHRKVALLFLDLDNFKTINDSLGHTLGDVLLREFAGRLASCVRDSDTLSRQGGDEFLIMLSDLPNTDAATPVLIKIRESLQTPFMLDGHELTTSASMGVALYPDDGRDFETLLKKADTAMYRAKDAGRNQYRFFNEQMYVEAVEHLRMKNGLQRALAHNEFIVHYQPQIDLRTGRVFGVEALVRWQHPDEGLIAPGRFIPAAEDSGLIVPMGEWVLREACRQAMLWREAGLPPMTMAVNISAVQFRRGDLPQTIAKALEETGFDPRLLELELTESVLINDIEVALANVRQLKQLGVKLSIDDFGTGYSSLSYLKRFAVDKLKIDQSFVRDLVRNPDDAAIVRAIIQMASGLSLRTLAEGVEDEATLAILREFGCEDAQGYYFARPMPAAALAAFVSSRPSTNNNGHEKVGSS